MKSPRRMNTAKRKASKHLALRSFVILQRYEFELWASEGNFFFVSFFVCLFLNNLHPMWGSNTTPGSSRTLCQLSQPNAPTFFFNCDYAHVLQRQLHDLWVWIYSSGNRFTWKIGHSLLNAPCVTKLLGSCWVSQAWSQKLGSPSISVSLLLQGCPSLDGVWNFQTSYEKRFQHCWDPT